MRQLTAQDVPVKQGRALSLPLVRARVGRLFIYEYQVEECSAELLVPVISDSCKSSLSLTLSLSPLVTLHWGSEQANRIGQRWHHRFYRCCVVRKLSLMQLSVGSDSASINRKSSSNIFAQAPKSLNSFFMQWEYTLIVIGNCLSSGGTQGPHYKTTHNHIHVCPLFSSLVS